MVAPDVVALREWTFVGCVLGLSCGAADGPAPPCEGRITQWRGAMNVAPSGLEAECLVIGAGSVVTIEDARTTVVRARTVVVEGDATIRGQGRPVLSAAPWTSGGASCAVAHFAWLDAVEQGRVPGAATEPGRDGGTFHLRYGHIIGGASRLRLLRFELDGGPGEPGQEIRCGCADASHGEEVARRAGGPAGAPGTWRFFESEP